MKTLSLLPLAFAASAFVIPDAETVRSLEVQSQDAHPFWDHVKDPKKIWEELDQRFRHAGDAARHRIDEAMDWLDDTAEEVHDTAVKYSDDFQEAFAGEAWLNSLEHDFDLTEGPPDHKHPPHHGPPHHGPPHHGPHHGHGKPNKTVYELIAESKYTTKLAKAINEFPDLVELLNGTEANYTVFAPTDAAFEKIPEHAPKPPKEFLKKLLTYHVSPEFYPAGRILVTRTIPSALKAELIGDVPQRLATQISLRGLTVNFYARVIAPNVFGTNGVIHGIDSILVPPFKGVDIISALPGEFSTLELALLKTGLYEHFNDTSIHHGGTLFAPTNFAFKLLGPRINAFLFSPYGLKYLKALILYHASGQATLYSDAIYKADSKQSDLKTNDFRIPKGLYHIDLESGLEGKSLSIDIARYGRLITIKINGFSRVSVSDGIAADGVIHGLSNVLIPPKKPGETGGVVAEDMSLEEFKERLAPFVDEAADVELEL